MVAVILPLLVQILANLPQAIESVKEIWSLVASDQGPTAEEQAAFDAALDAAHKALQAS